MYTSKHVEMCYGVIWSFCALCVIWWFMLELLWSEFMSRCCDLWSRCMCIYVKMCFCPWCNIYQSMKKICNSAAHFFTKTGVKLQRTQISKGKIARVMLSFRNKVNNVNCSSENRGRGYLSFEITGVKSQSWKNRGKITIRVHSRGKITNLPNFLT
jgi:hypothetical protein